MPKFVEQAAALAATAGEVAKLKGSALEARILLGSSATLVPTGYDNWNGGTDIYSLLLEVDVPLYAAVEDQREVLERSVLARVSQLTRTEVGSTISEVIISPKLLANVESQPRPSHDDGESIAEDTTPAPSFWAAGHFRAFISHASEKKERAHLLKAALADSQIAAFVAHDDVEPTKEWQAEIETALRTMDALVAIVSPAFLISKWCDQEVGVALGRGKLVLPLCAGADPHGFMGKLQGLQTRTLAVRAIADRVTEIMVQNNQSAPRMTEALVARMVNSTGWEMSKRTMSLLEKIGFLTADQACRLIGAIDKIRSSRRVHRT